MISTSNNRERRSEKTMSEQNITGFPSIDKPWLKYYSEEAINVPLPNGSMYEFLYNSNKNRLKNISLKYFGNNISYKEMFKNIKIVAKALATHGIKRGDVVSILSLNTPETTYVIYALNLIGAIANLLTANMTYGEIEENISETNSKLLFVLDRMMDVLENVSFQIPIIELPIANSAAGFEKIVLDFCAIKHFTINRHQTYNNFISKQGDIQETPEDLTNAPAVIIYTSGTTGSPKGVVLSNVNINSCAVQCSVSGKKYRPEQSFLNILPPFFSFGICMKHLCLYAGMTEIAVLIPKEKTVIGMIKKYRPERFVVGPAITGVIENYPGNDLSFLSDLTGGGGSISVHKERQLNSILKAKGAKSRYLSGYGMTELSAVVSMNYNNVCKEQSVGIPLPLVNVKVCIPGTDTELGYNQEGELMVSSPGLMMTYFSNEAETNSIIRSAPNGVRWIHSGDLAKIDSDGFIYITGRIKRIFVVKYKDVAYKLFPQRMEETIVQMPEVDKCGVIMQKDVEQCTIPVVFITSCGQSDNAALKDAVAKRIAKDLPRYYAPKNIVLLDKMPVNSSQKIDYRTLERMAAGESERTE